MEANSNDSLLLEALQIFGAMLKARRQQNEWSCYRISEKINVAPATISAVENGETWPSDSEREALADFLGYDVSTFDKIARRLRREQSPNVINLADHRK
ncbi:transcriptional regulator with XRE-family HTH domain [Neorhizobium galegae]|uniref:helix-turn-helix domain-containing protein n=1 Tax=Neorhizobium galegae TaxID=399 RepID=UPI00278230FE|nr:helix-turn-helix transcriptional regulator [Neorhizobium galegae]MDQ0135018.1 transcriptional regulator with XRE-family HTH domain [Neorhizobium galegae]